jgi:hypothetical protein
METATLHPDDRALVAWLSEQPGGAVKMPDAQITKALGWGDNRGRGHRSINRLLEAGAIVQRRGKTILNRERVRTIVQEQRPNESRTETLEGERTVRGENSRSSEEVGEPFAAQIPPSRGAVQPANEHGVQAERWPSEPAVETVYAHVLPRPPASRGEPLSALDVLTILAALSLTLCCAVLSVRGMLVLFPGIPLGAMWLGGGIEACKLTAAGWIGHRWSDIGWVARIFLLIVIPSAAALNAVGVYGQLVEGHVGARAQVSAGIEAGDAQAAARVEAAQGRLADVDRRIALNDAIVNGAAARGRANGAAEALRRQRTERASLVKERQGIAQEVASLKSDRAGAAAKGKATEAEALPIQYVAQLFGVQAGGEEVIRWFITGLVACGDPFAIILLGVVMSRRRRS